MPVSTQDVLMGCSTFKPLYPSDHLAMVVTVVDKLLALATRVCNFDPRQVHACHGVGLMIILS